MIGQDSFDDKRITLSLSLSLSKNYLLLRLMQISFQVERSTMGIRYKIYFC